MVVVSASQAQGLEFDPCTKKRKDEKKIHSLPTPALASPLSGTPCLPFVLARDVALGLVPMQSPGLWRHRSLSVLSMLWICVHLADLILLDLQ